MLKLISPYLCAAVVLLVSCGTESNETSNKNDTLVKDSSVIETPKAPEKIAYDTLLTETSRFIAGLEASIHFGEHQQKEFYLKHKDFTDKSWTTTLDSMIRPVQKWCAEKNIGDTRDSVLCFYPLSGPDFLFGNTFFPNADHYVLLGLEPRGYLKDMRIMSDNELMKYFDGIRQSMKYINSRGYFVTSHMSSDFTKAHLNGMVHMMLYMMARTEHKILGVYEVWIDENGKEQRLNEGEKAPDGKITASKIEFLSPDQTEKRDAYYFKLDASDKYLQDHTEFSDFINGFGPRVAYMKSASCVLQNTPFAIMRKLVIDSDKILQDDTGVPYKYFSEDSTLRVQLFGTYSKTIDDLSWCYQPSLRKALETSGNNSDLPFRISYNGNYGEGMLLWAFRK
ncbi:MAG: hypothetical protein ACK40M_00960 [Flavobacteriales bacterium]